MKTFVLIYTEKRSPGPSSGKLLEGRDRDLYRKITAELCSTVPKHKSKKTLHHLRLRELLRRKGRKILRARGAGSLL